MREDHVEEYETTVADNLDPVERLADRPHADKAVAFPLEQAHHRIDNVCVILYPCYHVSQVNAPQLAPYLTG
jgi:hypothetical protein